MKKPIFVYNKHTLQFERYKEPIGKKLVKLALGIVSIVFLSGVFLALKLQFYPSAEAETLMREIKQMEFKYMTLNHQLDEITSELNDVQTRDAQVHRLMFGMDPLDDGVWNGGVGGHNQYDNITMYDNSGELIVESQSKVDKLSRQLDIQTQSLDTLLKLAKKREDMFASIPSIKPVRQDKLARRISLLSGYGVRIHPVHKSPKMHRGIDFTAREGTPIYATGGGIVERVEKKSTGYGNNVIINHGYGYKTRYAHMKIVSIKKGQKVTKGQEIGKVGDTGLSTAPHLHYEVHLNNRAVNPILYCMDGLSTDEYQQLVALASVENQSFD